MNEINENRATTLLYTFSDIKIFLKSMNFMNEFTTKYRLNFIAKT